MGMIFVSAIPIVNLIMILVWAVAGENESRKNYFRAIIAWTLIMVALCVVLFLFGGGLGAGSVLQKFIQENQH
jgi:uncharacterized integral membrane protein